LIQALEPDAKTVYQPVTVTWNAETACWTDNYNNSVCGAKGWNGDQAFVAVFLATCEPIGQWSLELYDNGNQVWTPDTFSIEHNPSSQLGISSPLDTSNPQGIQLVDLAEDQNYTATDSSCPAPLNAQGNPTAVCLSAGTNTGNPVSWTATLNYVTSGKIGNSTDPRNFTTNSVTPVQNEVYQSEGG
jgi:hypothetical protein